MSAYVTLLTPMTDRECLLHALADVGFGEGKVEVHQEAVGLTGYEGLERAQRAHVVIRKQHVGGSSNDLGFLGTPTGHLLIVSDYDRRTYGQPWMQRLEARYVHHARIKEERAAEEERRRIAEEKRKLVQAQKQAIVERAKKLGYQVQEKREGDKVRLVLLRRVY